MPDLCFQIEPKKASKQSRFDFFFYGSLQIYLRFYTQQLQCDLVGIFGINSNHICTLQQNILKTGNGRKFSYSAFLAPKNVLFIDTICCCRSLARVKLFDSTISGSFGPKNVHFYLWTPCDSPLKCNIKIMALYKSGHTR